VSSSVTTVSAANGLFDDLNAQQCYQCGKCTAGCPMSDRMDLMPNQVVRLVQLGQVDKVVASETIWRCTSCQTCTSRCPRSVDCAGIMDRLRQMSFAGSVVAPAQRRTVLFQKAFLHNIRRNGRLNELELVGEFKTSNFLHDLEIPFLFKDATLAPRLHACGKLRFNGSKVRDRDLVDRIFNRCMD
jgi:heterodisulfide reductase subunit C2